MSGGIGDPQVRNWGTIGGSVAHADPASDWPAALLALNATIVCRGAGGDREIAARDFFLDTFTTAIEPTEVLVEVRTIVRPRGSGGAYTKLERRVGDFATAGVAALMTIGPDGTINRAGIGVTGVSASPFAVPSAEALLIGAAAGRRRRSAPPGRRPPRRSDPAGDVRGPVDYKRAMVAELTLRSLRTAAERARAYA